MTRLNGLTIIHSVVLHQGLIFCILNNVRGVYFQPKPKKVPAPAPPSAPVTPVKLEKVRSKHHSANSEFGRKYTRASTVSKTVETVKRQKERAIKAKKMLKKKMSEKKSTSYRQLTQEELLEEAKETEILNIESLKKFQQVPIVVCCCTLIKTRYRDEHLFNKLVQTQDISHVYCTMS